VKIVKQVLWQWVQRPGLERCELLRDGSHWVLRGTILGYAGAGPAEARYEVRCDDQWNTETTTVSIADDRGERAVRVARADGRWSVDGIPAPHLDICRDIDLGWSPSTNTVAIRRLNLAVGGRSEPLTMAWVRFPELTVELLPQAYERLDTLVYRYESRGGGFRADLTVDEEALVIDYEGIWKRLGDR
jgi:hypothetical protein